MCHIHVRNELAHEVRPRFVGVDEEAEDVEQTETMLQATYRARVIARHETMLQSGDPVGIWNEREVEDRRKVFEYVGPHHGTWVAEMENLLRAIDEINQRGSSVVNRQPGDVLQWMSFRMS